MDYLPINDYVGHDNRLYRDLAVEATPNDSVLAWLRRRAVDGKFFLVVSVAGGHVMRTEVTREEAVCLYHALATKIAYNAAFSSHAVFKKACAPKNGSRKASAKPEEPEE